MQQGIAFSKTLRALAADDFRASKLGLLVAGLVIAAWVWWLVGARVPQYESTTNVGIENGHVVAYFSSTSRLAVGQPALVRIDGRTIVARVQSIGPNYAGLDLVPSPKSPVPVSADIETARVSPASLALRSLGYRTR